MAKRSTPIVELMDTPILDATNEAIKKAQDDGKLGPLDVGAIAAIQALARKIDMMDVFLQIVSEDYRERGLRPPNNDINSIPAYLKYCDALGLTPAARARLNPKGAPAEGDGEPDTGAGGLRAV